jgi:hypothetical protein
MTELSRITCVLPTERFRVLIVAIAIWLRYLNFVEKHAQTLASVFDTESAQFVEMCFKKAIAATQYHIPEVSLMSSKVLTIHRVKGSGAVRETESYKFYSKSRNLIQFS